MAEQRQYFLLGMCVLLGVMCAWLMSKVISLLLSVFIAGALIALAASLLLTARERRKPLHIVVTMVAVGGVMAVVTHLLTEWGL